MDDLRGRGYGERRIRGKRCWVWGAVRIRRVERLSYKQIIGCTPNRPSKRICVYIEREYPYSTSAPTCLAITFDDENKKKNFKKKL